MATTTKDVTVAMTVVVSRCVNVVQAALAMASEVPRHIGALILLDLVVLASAVP